jgi:hypothetical protein
MTTTNTALGNAMQATKAYNPVILGIPPKPPRSLQEEQDELELMELQAKKTGLGMLNVSKRSGR